MSTYSPNSFRRKHVSALVALSLGVISGQALAQDQGQTPDDAEAKGLETITVTAQKRVQNLQEVPVAVSAFTGDEMAESVIKDLYDLRTSVPAMGTFQSQSATNSSFSIRGVGTSSQNFGLESSVGLYVDGVYRARQNSMINNLVDVQAVEVLRGPQGTLFGKNTPAGAIQIKTVAPSHGGGDAFVEVTAGNYGLFNYAGAASISAIEDVLAFRVTAFGSQRDGLVSDVNYGDDIINDRDRWGARVQALYTPNDDVSLRIIADYSEIDEICCAALTQLSNNKIGAAGVPGTDYILSNFFGATVFSGDDYYDYKTAVTTLPISQMEDQGLSAELNWDLNDNMTFVSISAWRQFDSLDQLDTDFGEAALFNTTNDSEQSSFSQELRLDYTGDKLNYILGLYYFEQDLDLNYTLKSEGQFGPFIDLAFLPQIYGSALGPLLNGLNQLSAATGGLIAPVGPAVGPDSYLFPHLAEQEHESYAIFGQFDYKFNDNWTLTAGLRYTDEEKVLNSQFFEQDAQGNQLVHADFAAAGASLQNIGFALATGGAPAMEDLINIAPLQTAGWALPLISANTAPRASINETLSESKTTGTLKLSYQPDSDTLIYASYGTGFKSGGTNTDRIAPGLDPVFRAEESASIELGIKKDFPEQNLRVNAAVHSTDYDDFQANTWTGNGFNLQNAGDITTSGLELEVTWLPMDSVEVNFAYAHTKAEFDTFVRGTCWVAYTWHTGVDDPGRQNPSDQFCDRSGDRLASEPEDYAVVSVKKDFELADNVYAYVLAEYSYTGDLVLDGSNDPYKVQDAYNILNLRFFMNFEDYDMDLILWGRNVLGEEYINGSDFDVPIQDGLLKAYVSEPATYGVTLKKRF